MKKDKDCLVVKTYCKQPIKIETIVEVCPCFAENAIEIKTAFEDVTLKYYKKKLARKDCLSILLQIQYFNKMKQFNEGFFEVHK